MTQVQPEILFKGALGQGARYAFIRRSYWPGAASLVIERAQFMLASPVSEDAGRRENNPQGLTAITEEQFCLGKEGSPDVCMQGIVVHEGRADIFLNGETILLNELANACFTSVTASNIITRQDACIGGGERGERGERKERKVVRVSGDGVGSYEVHRIAAEITQSSSELRAVLS